MSAQLAHDRPSHASHRARRGLTLLELTVALVVGGAALAAGGATVATLADRRHALLTASRHEERGTNARRALTAWITESAPDADGALRVVSVSQRTTTGRRDDDTLRVTTTADGDPRALRIFVARDQAAPALVALVQRHGADEQRIVLASGVNGFSAWVLSSAFGERHWQRGWTGGALRAEAVRLHLDADDGARLPAALRDDITIVLGAAR